MSTADTDQASARYRPEAIANYFLKKAEEDDETLTPMKIQKLVYYAYGWGLGRGMGKLFKEPIQAWPYGPVIPSLFYNTNQFGKEPIRGRIEVDSSGEERTVVDEDVVPHLDTIWNAYKDFSAYRLSRMTHMPETPWSQVSEKYGESLPRDEDIDADLIEKHFKERLSGDD